MISPLNYCFFVCLFLFSAYLFVFFSIIFRYQHNHRFPVSTAALQHLAVDPTCSGVSGVYNTAIKNCPRLNFGILSVITEVIAFL